jgi:hypothetical protein
MGNVVASAAAGASSFSIPPSSDRINFEDVQSVIANRGGGISIAGTSAAHTVTYLIISTLKSEFLNCVISGTVPAAQEEARINDILSGNTVNGDTITIIVYGLHATDETAYAKYEQLLKHGITRVCVYVGGMFEWLLLQDVYGADLFPTSGKKEAADIIKYRPQRSIIPPI